MQQPPLSAVESIQSHHVVDDFDCENDELNDWLKRFAFTSHRSDSARVSVVHRANHVVGYYALATGAITRGMASPRIAQGLPNHPVPVILLARLAVHRSEQGRGIGSLLLHDVLMKVAGIAEMVGTRALVIHAKNEEARAWYLARFEFDASPVDSLQLMLLMKDLRKAIE